MNSPPRDKSYRKPVPKYIPSPPASPMYSSTSPLPPSPILSAISIRESTPPLPSDWKEVLERARLPEVSVPTNSEVVNTEEPYDLDEFFTPPPSDVEVATIEEPRSVPQSPKSPKRGLPQTFRPPTPPLPAQNRKRKLRDTESIMGHLVATRFLVQDFPELKVVGDSTSPQSHTRRLEPSPKYRCSIEEVHSHELSLPPAEIGIHPVVLQKDSIRLSVQPNSTVGKALATPESSAFNESSILELADRSRRSDRRPTVSERSHRPAILEPLNPCKGSNTLVLVDHSRLDPRPNHPSVFERPHQLTIPEPLSPHRDGNTLVLADRYSRLGSRSSHPPVVERSYHPTTVSPQASFRTERSKMSSITLVPPSEGAGTHTPPRGDDGSDSWHSVPVLPMHRVNLPRGWASRKGSETSDKSSWRGRLGCMNVFRTLKGMLSRVFSCFSARPE
ncbi:hypothetical protein Moror_7440 [Moniliophthora roreri MCA 2997]|uniref:Uncharacterized protein n=1 Tax=Moniliophthora roreri (strain MCA 2997) TaxID=1381753 RepID=V2XU82_MONRO|nr:hypothetical protein Moror_7440 [Moniliophthora roreri MCA 2997]